MTIIDGFYWINGRSFRIVVPILVLRIGNFTMADANSKILPTFEQQLSFATSASLGLPDLIGGVSGVMGFAAAAPVVDGFLVRPGFTGTAPLKSYTLALDVYVDDAHKSKWFALLQTDPTNTTDAELLVNANSGIGINGSYNGSFTWDAWHRIVLTVEDLGNGNVTLSKYLDSALVGTQSMSASRFQIDPVQGFRIFSDDGASQVGSLETQPGFVSSVMFTDQVLTRAQVTALGGASAGGILSAALPAGQTVQFDFNPSAPLAPSIGTGSLEVVSAATDVLTGTGFGTTAELGIPALAGDNGSDEVMAYVGASDSQGYLVRPGIDASAADGKIHDYTLIWDIYAPAANGRWMALLQTDPTNVSDADFLLKSTNGIGISANYTGTFNYTGWNRVAVTVHDNGNGTVTLNKYINGTLVGTQQPSTNGEANAATRYAIDPDSGFLIFSDNGGAEVSQTTPETAPGYLNSVFFTDQVMSAAQIGALGGVKAGGIMQESQVDPAHAVQFDFNDGGLAPSIGDGSMALWDRSTGGATGEAQGIDDGGFATAHNTPITIEAAALLANDANPQNHTLVIQSVTAGEGGTVALDQNGNVVFTPEAGFAGQAEFSYTLSDGHGTTDSAKVTLSVDGQVLDQATQSARHVVFLGIDGTQLSRLLALAGNGVMNLDLIEAYAGGDLGTSTQQQTVSGPGWSTLLTGVWADEHHVTGNSNSPIDPTVMSLFERIKADIPGATTASIVSWADINNGHFALETGAGATPSIVDWHAVSTGASMPIKDADVIRQGVDLITNEAPTFTFLHLDNVDAVGHASGFGAAYDAAMMVAAAQLNAILVAVAERMAANPGEDWMVVVGTDHGRDPTSGSGHGGQTASERQIFIAANKEISSDGVAPQTSVAATIAEFLGLDQGGIRGPSVLDEDAIDTHAPYLLAATPGDDLQNVAIDAPLTLVLSERVEKGEGFITIRLAGDGSVVETIDVNSDRVSISAGVVTVQPSEPLAYNTGYYVTVDAGAFDDLETRGASPDGNVFAGISDAASWSFTTLQDTQAPGLVSLTPADNAGEIAPDAPLVLTFDEAVRKGEGSITIHRADGSVVETIDVGSDAVVIDGNKVTVQPGADFPAAGDYYVTVTAGAFEDLAEISQRVLFSENFESLTGLLQSYQSSSEIRDADPTDWTATAPVGWTNSNNTPAGGPVEFQGWNFHDKLAWTATEGDQGRSSFTKGQGVVAVADPDAYDDLNSASTPNKFSALLRTPEIDVVGIKDDRVILTFDNSWQVPANTNPQEARIVVTFDNGETRELAHWSVTSGSPFYKPTALNETLSFVIDMPEGATKMSLSFDMIQAGNAYWWAIDNVVVTGEPDVPHGNAFAGITDQNAWNFSVADTAPLATPVDDRLNGTTGDDAIDALAGDDIVIGLAGNDALDGGEGDDTLDGGEGDDLLKGGAGDDELIGGAGSDVLIGGAGDDVLDGGDGLDTADYSDDSAGVRVDLAAGEATGDDSGADELYRHRERASAVRATTC